MKLAFVAVAAIMTTGCASTGSGGSVFTDAYLAQNHQALNQLLRDARSPITQASRTNSEYLGFRQQVLGHDNPGRGVDVRKMYEPINQIQHRLDDMSNTARRLEVLKRQWK